MRNRIKDQNDKITILNAVIAVMCVLLAGLGIMTVMEFVSADPYSVDADRYQYSLEDENYVQMLSEYYYDTKPAKKKQKYFAVAEYFEAATLYHAFSGTGETIKAEKYKKRMEQAADKMEDLRSAAEKIDAELAEY